MALHDTDKSTSRSRPQPASHDQLDTGSLMAKGTNSVNYITGASPVSSLSAGKNGQFTIVDSGVWDGSTTSFTTLNPGAGTYGHDIQVLTQIPHSLSFTPAYAAFFLQPGTSQYTPLPYFSFNGTASTGLWMNLHMITTSNEFLFVASYIVYGGAWTVSFDPIKWYLMQQTAN